MTTIDAGTGLVVTIANDGTPIPRPPRRSYDPTPPRAVVRRVAPRDAVPFSDKRRVVVQDQTQAITEVLIPLVQQMLAVADSGRPVTPLQMTAFTAQYVEAERRIAEFRDTITALEGELEVAADALRYLGGGE